MHGTEIVKIKILYLSALMLLLTQEKFDLLIIKLSKVMCTVEQTIDVQMGNRGMAPPFL
jgi:hypothetical protein